MSPQNPQAQGLDLVREVLFGADKRQTSQEFTSLKAQLNSSNELIREDIAALEKALGAKIFALQESAHAQVIKLEALIAHERAASEAALNQLRAQLATEQSARASAADAERAALVARDQAFVGQMRTALDTFVAQHSAKK